MTCAAVFNRPLLISLFARFICDHIFRQKKGGGEFVNLCLFSLLTTLLPSSKQNKTLFHVHHLHVCFFLIYDTNATHLDF